MLWFLFGSLVNAQNALPTLEDVYLQQRKGQYIEAQVLLDELIALQRSPQIQFEWARNLEFQQQYDAAILVYDDLYFLRLAGDFGLNIAYRRALMLSNLGRHSEALKTLRRLRWRRLSQSDRRAVSLALGAAEIMAGLTQKGIRRVEKTLDELVTPTEWSWLQARARMAICEHMFEKAQSIEVLIGVDLENRMDERANWILEAEKHIQVIIQLQEPEYVLRSIESIADALVTFYDDVASIPPPQDFTLTQRSIFQEEMSNQGRILLEKALGYYQQADRFGDGLSWKGSNHARIHRKVVVLQSELIGLP